jgi:hypothetical protein
VQFINIRIIKQKRCECLFREVMYLTPGNLFLDASYYWSSKNDIPDGAKSDN